MGQAQPTVPSDVLRALVDRICAILECDRAELRASSTPEGLIELRVARVFAERGPSRTTVVGSLEQLQQWVERLAVEASDPQGGR